MKKIIFSIAAAALLSSCSTSAVLLNSSSYKKMDVQPVAAVIADLQVASEKITYTLVPSKSVLGGGYDNVLNTAVREALLENGGYDVLVAMETQTKYSEDGTLESITVSGYPAKYTNFRSPDDSFWTSDAFTAIQNVSSEGKQNKLMFSLGNKK